MISLDTNFSNSTLHVQNLPSTYSTVTFDGNDWKSLFGDVGDIPPISSNIYNCLNNTCPFDLSYFGKKKVFETHFLTLIPSHVNGRKLTLNYLRELIEAPKNHGFKTQYRGSKLNDILQIYGNREIENSYWILLTKNVVPSTKNQNYYDQLAIIKRYDYEPPDLLEAAVTLLAQYVKRKDLSYPHLPQPIYSRCIEDIEEFSPLVGGFSDAGLCFNRSSKEHTHLEIGMAAVIRSDSYKRCVFFKSPPAISMAIEPRPQHDPLQITEVFVEKLNQLSNQMHDVQGKVNKVHEKVYDIAESIDEMKQQLIGSLNYFKSINDRIDSCNKFEGNEYQNAFYYQLRSNLNNIFIAASVGQTNFFQIQSQGNVGIAESVITTLSNLAPGFSGVQLISSFLNYIGTTLAKQMLDNYKKIAVDSPKMAEFADSLSRKIAKLPRETLNQVDKPPIKLIERCIKNMEAGIASIQNISERTIFYFNGTLEEDSLSSEVIDGKRHASLLSPLLISRIYSWRGLIENDNIHNLEVLIKFIKNELENTEANENNVLQSDRGKAKVEQIVPNYSNGASNVSNNQNYSNVTFATSESRAERKKTSLSSRFKKIFFREKHENFN